MIFCWNIGSSSNLFRDYFWLLLNSRDRKKIYNSVKVSVLAGAAYILDVKIKVVCLYLKLFDFEGECRAI